VSKVAVNMMSINEKNIAIGIFHPGFNKTDMTAKCAEIWEVEGAIAVGAKRVFHEIGLLNMETTGKSLIASLVQQCDGLHVPHSSFLVIIIDTVTVTVPDNGGFVGG